METNKTKKGGGLIIAAIFAVFLLVAFLFVVYPLAIIAVIIALIAGVLIYKSLIKLKTGTIIDKTVVPEHQEERRRSTGGRNSSWITVIETVPEAYYLTIKGERGGKERTQLFEVPKNVYATATIGTTKAVTSDFLLQLVPIEEKFKNWVGKTEEEARKEGLDREAALNTAEIVAVEMKQEANPTAEEVATKTNFNLFSIIGVGLNLYLIYLFLRLWISPQYDDAEFIYSLGMLLIFEFVLVHSGAFMAVLAAIPFRDSWKWWLVLIVFYGIFALVFNMFVVGNEILIVYGAVVLNRFLSKIGKSEKQKEIEMGMSAVYGIIYFVLLFAIVLGQDIVPQFGLTDEFLRAVDWDNINQGVNVLPNALMLFGVLYYLLLTIVDLTLRKQPVSEKAKEPSSEEKEMEEYFKKRR